MNRWLVPATTVALAVVELTCAAVLVYWAMSTWGPSGFGIGEVVRWLSLLFAGVLSIFAAIALKMKQSLWPHLALLLVLFCVSSVLFGNVQ